MGFIKHDGIVCTGSTAKILASHAVAVAHFAGSPVHVSTITETTINDTASYLVAPDGSKEGWTDSADGDTQRAGFIAWLRTAGFHDWVHVRFGGDDGAIATWVEDHSQASARAAMEAPKAAPAVQVLVAETLRAAASWLDAESDRQLMLDAATNVELAVLGPNDGCCPLCEEVRCDDGCPLQPFRAQYYTPGSAL